MKKAFVFVLASACLSGCVVPNEVVYDRGVVEPNPVLVYPEEPYLGETVVIDGDGGYRHHRHR